MEREHSESREVSRDSPPRPEVFWTRLQVQSRLSRTSDSFRDVSSSSWVFFFSWELSSVTAS